MDLLSARRALADDNVYTNLMARRNLLAAIDAAKRYPGRARDLGVSDEESAGWHDAAEAMSIPFDEKLGLHPQAEGFTRQQAANFAYYERLTVRDSSLSACTQAVIAAEVGHLHLAFDYLGEAALWDHADYRGPGAHQPQ
jgi:alpha,alpha-trehalose phosphorylase